MTAPAGEVVPNDDPRKPFKVVFKHGDKLIAEHPVTSMREGRPLIESILP